MPTRERRARMLGIAVDQLPDGRGKHGNHVSGRNHYRWNTGRIVSEHGYVKVRVGEHHPLADPHGYAYEHLMVWATAGRELPGPTEIIHHKNEDKSDNRLDNLEKMTRAEHGRHHITDRARDASGRLLDGAEHNAMPEAAG